MPPVPQMNVAPLDPEESRYRRANSAEKQEDNQSSLEVGKNEKSEDPSMIYEAHTNTRVVTITQ